MEELEQILCQHAARYPAMEPVDAVKLIYQNEFGGGHLIRNEQACLEHLEREYEAVPPDPSALRQEPIGNGMMRVNLASVRPEELAALGQAFLHSAANHRGDMQRFLQKLEVLRRLTAQGIFPFDSWALEQYLKEYERAGFPAVSHSAKYKNAYHPAYRVIETA